jgi:hypothetical protein
MSKERFMTVKPVPHRVDPRVKAVKDLLVRMNTDPPGFASDPFAQPETLQRLGPAGFSLTPHFTASEQAREALKALVLALGMEQLLTDAPEQKLLQGQVLAWYSTLENIDPERPIGSLEKVIRYCADPEHLGDYLDALKGLIQTAYRDKTETMQKLLVKLSAPAFRPWLIAGFPAQPSDNVRRTLLNYLNQALLQLAIRIQTLAPEALPFRPERPPDQPSPEAEDRTAPPVEPERKEEDSPHPATLDPRTGRSIWPSLIYILGMGGAYGVRVEARAPRTVRVHSLRGESEFPAIPEHGASSVMGMGGAVTGLAGSGRTFFLCHLAAQSAKVLQRDPQAPLGLVHQGAGLCGLCPQSAQRV